MSRRAISPTLDAGSSPQYTFEVMQRRLEMAEEETKKLVEQLAEYGFNRDREDIAESTKTGLIEPVKPFKATGTVSPQMEILQRNYEQMVARVCRAESTIQSLKLAMCSLEAEKNLAAVDKEPDEVTLPKDTYENEIKKLKKDVQRYKKELEICEKGRNEAQDMVKRLASELDKSSQNSEKNTLKMEELKLTKQKLTKKMNELKEELVREKDLRASLEESHTSLLQRVSDMERIVESERGDVHTLAQDCRALRKEAVSAREECEKAQCLKGQLEALVIQLQEDAVNSDSQLATLTSERKTLDTDITRLDKENKELRQQFELLRKNHEDLKGEHENIMSEHHRATNALRTTTADNKILISQHQGALQREREQWNVRIAEQERMLEKARSEMAQEVAREKEKQQLLENEKFVLKEDINKLQRQLLDEKSKTQQQKQDFDTEVLNLRAKIDAMTKEREQLSKESDQIMNEDVPPSEVISLEYVKDAWMEFNDQLDPGNVPWSEVPDHLVEEMVKYLKAMFRGNQDPAKEPSTHLVKQRIKRYYRAQRQQKITASSPTRRRRRRFQNRKNRLTMKKRDKEMDKANRQGALNGLSTEEIFERRERISPVKSKAVAVPPDSDDEDAKRDLLCRRKLFLKNARKVASARRAKARLLLEAVERPGGSHLQVRDLLKLTESNQANPQIPVVPSPPDKVFVPESPLSSQN